MASLSVVNTARGTRRLAREDRKAQASGSPRNRGIFDPKLLRGALLPAVRKMNPLQLARNPVMFVVEVTAALVIVMPRSRSCSIQSVTVLPSSTSPIL